MRQRFLFAGVPFLSRAFIYWCKTYVRSIAHTRKKYSSIVEIIDCHYKHWSSPNHRTRTGMEIAILASDDIHLIVETGTSAWGCDSTRLLDLVAKKSGAIFASVDIRPEASLWLKHQVSKQTMFFVQDSLEFFEETFPRNFKAEIDLAYLDSFDLDFEHPEASELHCYREFEKVCQYSRVGTIILIDDTPSNLDEIPTEHQLVAQQIYQKNDRLPGKGALVLERVKNDGSFEILWHSHNLVVRILKSNPLRNQGDH